MSAPLRRSTRLNRLNEFSQSNPQSPRHPHPLRTLVDEENAMSEEEKRYSRPKSKKKKPVESSDDEDKYVAPKKSRPLKKKKIVVESSQSDNGESSKEPTPKKARQQAKKAVKSEKSDVKAKGDLKSKQQQSKKADNKENKTVEDQMEVDELEALNLPSLNAPREWVAHAIASSKNYNMNMSEDESSEWDEVEAPVVIEKKKAVEVVIEKKNTKKDKEKQEYERQLRLDTERALKIFQEDCHKLCWLTFLSHLRYSMICVKEFCAEKKDELVNSLIGCDLNTTDGGSIEEKLVEFRDKFTEDLAGEKLCAEDSKEGTINRLHAIFKESTFQTNKDLAMALASLFLASDIPCRLCIGFTPVPDLPTNSKKAVTKVVKVDVADELSDSDVEDKKPSKKQAPKVEKPKVNYWTEYFDEGENDFVPVHPMNKNMYELDDVEKYAKFNYALAVDKDLNVTEITGWYVTDFLLLKFRKTRLNDTWINSYLQLPEFCSDRKLVAEEAHKLQTYLLSQPFPKYLTEYKNHPLYALERDLLKFEAFYPPNLKPLGQVRNHDIFPRTSVFVLQGELNWIRQARSVKEGEEPYKVVKARPKLSTEERVPLFLDVFGYWQTEPYVVPKVIDGKIQKNEHGNIYLYQPSMVPENCVHLREKGVFQMARTLKLEAVRALIGWEFSGGRNHPVFDGCVVLEEDAEVLRNACLEFQEIRSQKKVKAVEDRALQLWKRLVKGKLLLEKMRKRFNVT